MAQTSFPFENIDTSETQFSQWARNIGEGVRPNAGNELAPIGDSTGMNVKVATGQSLVRGHYYVSTAQVTLAISPSDVTNPRIDNVVLELDPAANTILLKVVPGTPAGSPTAPALVQTDAGIYQQLIAEVTVGANVTTIDPSDVEDKRTFIASFDGTISAAGVITGFSDKSANYTLLAADKNTYIRSTGSAITITVPDVLENGESVNFIQAGAGQITFAGSGVTLNSKGGKLKTKEEFSGATITKVGNAYYLIGDLD
jgi:hypothetical protein